MLNTREEVKKGYTHYSLLHGDVFLITVGVKIKCCYLFARYYRLFALIKLKKVTILACESVCAAPGMKHKCL